MGTIVGGGQTINTGTGPGALGPPCDPQSITSVELWMSENQNFIRRYLLNHRHCRHHQYDRYNQDDND